MDKIQINGILCEARLGMSKTERAQLQQILIDVEVGLDLEAAANTDSLDLTVDYETLLKRIEKNIRDHECHLIESVAGNLCKSILADARIRTVTVRVRKFPESMRDRTDSVGVEMTRTSG